VCVDRGRRFVRCETALQNVRLYSLSRVCLH